MTKVGRKEHHEFANQPEKPAKAKSNNPINIRFSGPQAVASATATWRTKKPNVSLKARTASKLIDAVASQILKRSAPILGLHIRGSNEK